MVPFILIVAIVAIAIGFLFNRLVGLRNRAASAWSDIDVQLKQRHDLIRNLVETVKGYATHERSTLEEITQARAGAEGARAAGVPSDAAVAESALDAEVVAVGLAGGGLVYVGDQRLGRIRRPG